MSTPTSQGQLLTTSMQNWKMQMEKRMFDWGSMMRERMYYMRIRVVNVSQRIVTSHLSSWWHAAAAHVINASAPIWISIFGSYIKEIQLSFVPETNLTTRKLGFGVMRSWFHFQRAFGAHMRTYCRSALRHLAGYSIILRGVPQPNR
jgi:hypothetical protein